jgi:primosomal protein N'
VRARAWARAWSCRAVVESLDDKTALIEFSSEEGRAYAIAPLQRSELLVLHYVPHAALIVSGADKHETEGFARKLAAASPLDDSVRVLGPAEAPLAVVRGRYRYRLLIKSPRNFDLSYYVRGWLEHAPKTRGSLKLEVDIDPQSFY